MMIDSDLKNANILIVDDQEANIDVLSGFLEVQGYTHVKSTTDPREVVGLMASFAPDLLLLDLSMPFLSGFEVMEQLKSLSSEHTFIPVLVLTADVSSEAKRKALASGATDFLTKPFDLVEVGLRIKNLLLTSFLHKQLEEQNKILDETVKLRTKELEQTNHELRLAKEQAESSDRLKTAFINNISHEIRTPLNGIIGFAQLLTSQDAGQDKKDEFFHLLKESSDRLIDTVTNYMDISLLRSGTQSIDIRKYTTNQLLDETIEQFKPACKLYKLELVVNVPPELSNLSINTDKELLTKALKHLLSNALKFTRTGSITVVVDQIGNKLLFAVKDTGIGMSDDKTDDIFDAFSQSVVNNVRTHEGNGLGLAIAKGAIDLLKGKIWFESQLGKGSNFFFTIPIDTPPALPHAHATKQQGFSKPAKHVVLVVEDDDLNFVYFEALLRQSNTEIIRAVNGMEAVKTCQNNSGINLVLMDLKLPIMNGFEATKLIKSMRKNLPIFATTAFASRDERQKAMEAGCDEFLVKPIKKNALFDKLSEYGITTH